MNSDKPSHILLLGANHETAPVAVREKLSFAEQEVPKALSILMAMPVIQEVILFSTCNRMEILLTSGDVSGAVASVKAFLQEQKQLSEEQYENIHYLYQDEEAVRHLFRVASGLDSMIMGEPQIFGQIKAAYRQAVNQQTTGVILNRLIHRTFFVAKRVRSETGIGDNAVSVSYAAIELGRKIFGSLEEKQVLLIGAGEMAELAVEHLVGHHVTRVFVANRTFRRAVDLAKKFSGTPVSMEEISEILQTVDIVVSSTGSADLVVTRAMVKPVMRRRKNSPLFFIDIAVPRDIDPSVHKLENAYLYDIDDLREVVDENLAQRRLEAVKAERIIEEAWLSFRNWYDHLAVVPTVVALREKIADIARTEADKTMGSLPHLSESDRAAIYRMTDAIVNKVMHDPTTFLKSVADKKDERRYIDMVKKLFGLDE